MNVSVFVVYFYKDLLLQIIAYVSVESTLINVKYIVYYVSKTKVNKFLEIRFVSEL